MGRCVVGKKLCGVLAVLFCAFLFSAVLAGLSGDANAIRLTAKRITFEGSVRAADLSIINDTDEEQVYRLGFKVMRMTSKGVLETVEGDDGLGNAVADMVRFSPRRVVIPVGGAQQVRMMLNKPASLPDGEYRAHFWIRPEMAPDAFEADPTAHVPGGASIQIKMLTGATVPVFVRTGQTHADVKLEGVTAKRDGENVSVAFDIVREGNRSLYGDFDFVCNGSTVQQVRGIAVYTDIERRSVDFTVPVPKSCSEMNVIYRAEKNDAFFNGRVMATGVVQLP